MIFLKGHKCTYRAVLIIGDGIHTRKELYELAINPEVHEMDDKSLYDVTKTETKTMSKPEILASENALESEQKDEPKDEPKSKPKKRKVKKKEG